jgi:hypothetical protein
MIVWLGTLKRPKQTRSSEKVMSHIKNTHRGIGCRPLYKEKTAAIWKKNQKRPLILTFRPSKVMTKSMINIGLIKLRKSSNSIAIKMKIYSK